MARRLLAFALVVLVTALGISRAEQVNKSASGGLLWPTDGAGHVVGNTETDESLDDHDELDGGFPSLDGMLQWAIGHSDPSKLEMKAHDVQQLSVDELQKRQMELKELVEKLELPSDAKLMKVAIDDLKNLSISLENRHRALEELLVLVESIDNANDLHKMGGLSVVIRDLSNSDSGIRTICAWVIGKASQNNPLVQEQILELGALRALMMMVKSDFTEEAIKALYAVSSVIRNNKNGIELFYSEGGELMVQGVLSNRSADVRLHRRLVVLVSDLAEYQLEQSTKPEPLFFSSCSLVKPILGLATSNDLDLQEKVLVAVKNLLNLKSTKVLVVDGFCGLSEALERMRQQLQAAEGSRREYSNDVEILRREVTLIYTGKLNEVSQVPT